MRLVLKSEPSDILSGAWTEEGHTDLSVRRAWDLSLNTAFPLDLPLLPALSEAAVLARTRQDCHPLPTGAQRHTS